MTLIIILSLCTKRRRRSLWRMLALINSPYLLHFRYKSAFSIYNRYSKSSDKFVIGDSSVIVDTDCDIIIN